MDGHPDRQRHTQIQKERNLKCVLYGGQERSGCKKKKKKKEKKRSIILGTDSSSVVRKSCSSQSKLKPGCDELQVHRDVSVKIKHMQSLSFLETRRSQKRHREQNTEQEPDAILLARLAQTRAESGLPRGLRFHFLNVVIRADSELRL
ncbi:hypothetical protein ABVT39_020257 [Epinephelus coioides]